MNAHIRPGTTFDIRHQNPEFDGVFLLGIIALGFLLCTIVAVGIVSNTYGFDGLNSQDLYTQQALPDQLLPDQIRDGWPQPNPLAQEYEYRMTGQPSAQHIYSSPRYQPQAPTYGNRLRGGAPDAGMDSGCDSDNTTRDALNRMQDSLNRLRESKDRMREQNERLGYRW